MALLTKKFLSEIGIELDEASYAALDEHYEETLDERVVDEIVEYLTPEQAAELAAMKDRDGNEIYTWLNQAVPEIHDIISDEVDILLGEIAENSEQIAS